MDSAIGSPYFDGKYIHSNQSSITCEAWYKFAKHGTNKWLTCFAGISNLCLYIINTTVSSPHVDGKYVQSVIQVFLTIIVIYIGLKVIICCLTPYTTWTKVPPIANFKWSGKTWSFFTPEIGCQIHYENLPMQYIYRFFSVAKIENFIRNFLIFFLLLLKT